MARDALETELVNGELVFTNLPRKADGTPDWDRLGGAKPYWQKAPDGTRHLIDPRPSVPHPEDGRPVRPS